MRFQTIQREIGLFTFYRQQAELEDGIYSRAALISVPDLVPIPKKAMAQNNKSQPKLIETERLFAGRKNELKLNRIDMQIISETKRANLVEKVGSDGPRNAELDVISNRAKRFKCKHICQPHHAFHQRNKSSLETVLPNKFIEEEQSKLRHSARKFTVRSANQGVSLYEKRKGEPDQSSEKMPTPQQTERKDITIHNLKVQKILKEQRVNLKTEARGIIPLSKRIALVKQELRRFRKVDLISNRRMVSKKNQCLRVNERLLHLSVSPFE